MSSCIWRGITLIEINGAYQLGRLTKEAKRDEKWIVCERFKNIKSQWRTNLGKHPVPLRNFWYFLSLPREERTTVKTTLQFMSNQKQVDFAIFNLLFQIFRL